MTPVVIPFYRHRDKLDRCLAHLARQSVPAEPVVIDNNTTNRYFTAAVNDGLKRCLASSSPYYMILNQDMYLAEDAIERLVAFLDSNPGCGIASPLQLSTETPGHVDFAGGTEAFPLGFYLNGPRDDWTEDREVYWAGGGCLILRAEMVREIGLLDPNLRFFGSDSDYCFTARTRGWSTWVVAGATGEHDAGTSKSVQSDSVLERIKLDDILYFAAKWLTGELYRRLALEGPKLDAARVQTIVAHFRRVRDELDHGSPPHS
jgi:GT2 family glycosyltransferase